MNRRDEQAWRAQLARNAGWRKEALKKLAPCQHHAVMSRKAKRALKRARKLTRKKPWI